VSPRWRERLHATLGADGARVRLTQRGARAVEALVEYWAECDPPAVEFAEATAALDGALQQMAAQGYAIGGLCCDVAIGDGWMLYDVFEADLDGMPRRAADELVRAALADTLGVAPGDIVAQWRREGDRSFACALPANALQSLRGVLERHALRLGRATGDFAIAYETRQHALGAGRHVLAVPRVAGAQLGLVVDGHLAATRFEPGIADSAALGTASRALMRCCGVPADDRTSYHSDRALAATDAMAWIDAVDPPGWRERLRASVLAVPFDLARPRPRVSPWGWALLAAGALSAAVAALQFQTASGQQLHAAHALRTLEASLEETRSGRSGGGRPADTSDARAAAAVVRELQVPWSRLFSAFEAVARADVALLSVEPSAAKQEVRIVAEAKSSEAMFDFLDALGTNTLRRVTLVSHQVQSQTPGAPVRFQARAAWDTR
jgi:hypothetical protein